MLDTEIAAAVIGNGGSSGEKGDAMKVKFVRNTVAAKQAVRVGDVLELPESEARLLLHMGKAEIYAEPEAVETEEGGEPLEVVSEKPKSKRK